MTQRTIQEHYSPKIVLFRDTEGDFLISFDGGTTSCYITLDGRPVDALAVNISHGDPFDREVWRSGP